MRSSIAKATGVALIAGAVLLGAAGTASAHHCPPPQGALAVGGDATSIGDDAAALAVGGDALAVSDEKGDDDNSDEGGAKALAVGGDATAIGDDDAAALAVGGDAFAAGDVKSDDNGGDNGGDDDCA